MDHHISKPLPLLEAAFWRRDASTSDAYSYHNHVLQGNALRYMVKELTPKEVGQYRLSLVQGTRKGAMASIYLNETSELCPVAGGSPHAFIINVTGINGDGAVQRWQLSLSSAEAQVEWYEALGKARDFVSLIESSGENDLAANLFQSMSQAVRTGPRIYGLKIYQSCFKGSQAIHYLTTKLDYNAQQALNISANLLNLRFIEHVANLHAFHGDSKHLYRFNKKMMIGGGRGATSLISALLLPVNLMVGGGGAKGVGQEGSVAPATDSMVTDGESSDLSPTTIHLLRLRKQVQVELKAAKAAIEMQQAQINHLQTIHERNLAKGNLLLTRTRRVEILNCVLQVLLVIVSLNWFGFIPGFIPVHMFTTVAVIACSVLFHLAPVYRFSNSSGGRMGRLLISSTEDVVFDQFEFIGDAKTENVSAEDDKSPDDEDEEDDEEDDDDDDDDYDDDEEAATGGGPMEGGEAVHQTIESTRQQQGDPKLFKGDYNRLRKLHDLLVRVRRKKQEVSSAPVSTQDRQKVLWGGLFGRSSPQKPAL